MPRKRNLLDDAERPSLPLMTVTPVLGAPSAHYPFNLPALRSLPPLEFTTPVTFLVGENGSGKSTLLEALALAADAIAVGSHDLSQDPELRALRPLADRLHLSWSQRTRQGFYLRAEDFFGFTHRIAAIRQDLEARLAAVHTELGDGPAFKRAAMPFHNELSALRRQYGAGLDTRSHGESFLDVFQTYLRPRGLYLLDEPEAALSPLRQLALLTLMSDAVKGGAQFIVATHSPLLMAYPGATILQFDADAVRAVPYAEVEHVRLTRDFLQNPQPFVQHLTQQASDEP